MLRLYPVVVDWVVDLRPSVDAITRRDRGLGDQLRRSSTSVVLNLAEGMGAVGAVKTNCYRIALKEMRESMAAVEVAGRLGYMPAFGEALTDRQDKIVATLVRLAKPTG